MSHLKTDAPTRTNHCLSLVEVGQLLVAIAIPLGLGFLSSIFGGGGDSEWYQKLEKPSWTPPPWAFPLVWSVLYILMGVASFLVYRQRGFRSQAAPLGVYAVQLVFNFGWSLIFFGLQRPDLAFGWIILLLVAVAANIYFFYNTNPIAAYLLIPLLAWSVLATCLNFYIWQHNPSVQLLPRSGRITAPFIGGYASA